MQTLKPFERKKCFVLLTYGRVFDVMLSLNSGQTDIPTVGCQILFLFVPLGLLSVLINLWLDIWLSANIVFCFYLEKN